MMFVGTELVRGLEAWNSLGEVLSRHYHSVDSGRGRVGESLDKCLLFISTYSGMKSGLQPSPCTCWG